MARLAPRKVCRLSTHCTLLESLLAEGVRPGAKGDGIPALVEAAKGTAATTALASDRKRPRLMLEGFRRAGCRRSTTAEKFNDPAKFNEEVIAAATKGDSSKLEGLLTEGASAEAKDGSGNPALVLAVVGGHLDALRLLRQHGANLEATDSIGTTALVQVAANGKADCAGAQ
eukprot:COSAG04_NODE_12502_length_649_cov_1.716364_1_plen_171_part_10